MKNIVKIHTERCKSCGLCVHVCPQKILHIGEIANSKGYYAVEIQDQDRCKGCAFCALICPDLALEVYREEKGE
ncbi:MAG: 4Fe-4S binding protein [Desulfitobacteriaceae bacterium]|nr:4Fe-4S binding protein [Desulfitobacteriaceae bacterium]MDI6879196.1 4Fe-4S binding protein [Desulfitobacteriaceae bacterium]